MSCRKIRAVAALSVLTFACSTPAASTGPIGGPVDGAADSHCAGDSGLITQPTSQASCHAQTDGGGEEEETPPTHYGTAAYDDDCKYYLSYVINPVQKGKDVELIVSVTDITTGAPLKGAGVLLETTLGDTHAGPAPESTEHPDGTYTLKPFQFDASGRWTVRFHLFSECNDLVPDSPHGHVAFFIDVP